MVRGRSSRLTFQPRARLLLLLGDQLIRDPGIAVFELVKNAYDADATGVTITMKDIADKKRGFISVEDDGSGMSFETVTGVWLEPGTDYRSEQRQAGFRTTRFGRLPLGEKGVGRFAVHKLGREITLITRSYNQPEVIVNINWDDFDSARYLQDVQIVVQQGPPVFFTGDKTGTRIEIRRLRSAWGRKMVRDTHRSVTSIFSPFERVDSFRPKLVVDPDYGWLKGLLNVADVLTLALFHGSCAIDHKSVRYQYSFTPFPGMDKVKGREIRDKVVSLPKELDPYKHLKIGPIKLRLSIFDRDPKVLSLGTSDKRGLNEFLKENGGIRVYRDGIRIYDYGEPGNDWLDLGGKRVNVPTKRISNNIVVGAATLSLECSQDLVEKTNREGFVENEAYDVFQGAVEFALQQIVMERNIDKDRIRRAYSQPSQKEPVLDDLLELRTKVEQQGLGNDLADCIDRIEKQFLSVRDQLLTAAGAGLSMAMVIHEVEKGVGEIAKAIERNAPTSRLRQLAQHLTELVDGLAYLTRKSGSRTEKASVLIQQALFNTEFRLRYHHIRVINGIKKGGADFSVKCTRRLIVASLMNLIDNAIYWVDVRGEPDKQVYVGTSMDLEGGPAIVVADNGPGFMDPPEYMIQPFMSRRPDGMGLGLHLASEVMKAHGGRLEFPNDGDLELPDGFDGAKIALVFSGGRE